MDLVSPAFPMNSETPQVSVPDSMGVSGQGSPGLPYQPPNGSQSDGAQFGTGQRTGWRQSGWHMLYSFTWLLALAVFCPLAVLTYVAARINKWMVLVVIGPSLVAMAYLLFGPPSDRSLDTNIVLAMYPFLQSAAICLDITFSLLAGLALYARLRTIHGRPIRRHILTCLTLLLSLAANYPLHSFARLQSDQAYAMPSALATLKDRLAHINQLEDNPKTRESLRLALLAANHAIGKPPPRAQESAAAFRLLISASAACALAVRSPDNVACILAEHLTEPAITQLVPRQIALLAMLDPRRAILRVRVETPAEEFLVAPQPTEPRGSRV